MEAAGFVPVVGFGLAELRLPARLDEPDADRVVNAREQVPVDIHRHGDRGVAEPGLDRLRMGPGGDQEAGGRVPRTVIAALLFETKSVPKLARD